jgi:plasmid stabilization system protein ParE
MQLQERIELLRTSPLTGRVGALPTTREVVFDDYIVVYLVKDASIDVARIWHAKQRRPRKR